MTRRLGNIWLRLLPTLLGLSAGFAILAAGLAALQDSLRRERSEARDAVHRQRQTLEIYAHRSLVQQLEGQMRGAERQISDALADPLASADGIFLFEGGEQILPRRFRALAGDRTPAADLFHLARTGEITPGGDAPWAKHVELHLETLRAVRRRRSGDIERSFRALLEHRANFRPAPGRDLALTLAGLTFFETHGEPAPELMRALLLDGVRGRRGDELPDLSRQLLAARPFLSKADFVFLSQRLIELAERTGVPFEALAARCQESGDAEIPWRASFEGPTLFDGARWYGQPEGKERVLGVAVDWNRLMSGLDAEMRARGLLDTTESVAAPPPAKATGQDDLRLSLASSRFTQRLESIEERYRWKSALVVLCLMLALAMAVMTVAFQWRRLRWLEGRQAFIATVSHELRTPLASVRLMAETVARRTRDLEAVRDYPERMVREIDGLTFLVENILSFNRLDRGSAVPRLKDLDLAEMFTDLRQDLAQLTPRPIALETTRCRGVLRVDAELFTLAMSNLLRNGCLYNDRDPVVLEVTHHEEEGRHQITVQDNGRGIDPRDAERIFEDFYRPANSRPGGTGLGLALCRRILAMHGGTVRLERSDASGSVFKLEWPTQIPEAQGAT